MTQESRLAITIDSRPAKKNADDLSDSLNKVEQSGDGAAISAENLSQVTVKLGSNMGKMATAAVGALDRIEKSTASADRQMSVLVSKSDALESAMQAVGAGVSRIDASLTQSNTHLAQMSSQIGQLSGGFSVLSSTQSQVNAQLIRVAAALEQVASGARQVDAGMESVSRSTKEADTSLEQQRQELTRLIGQINPAVAALDRLDAMQDKLGKFNKAGLLDSDTFEEYTGRLKDAREELGRTSTGMNQAGMSAKAYQNALRGLPAQFTDIAVSLQGGQAPLTVLLQQGGQLKDMFGGVGPAARAMGGYILGLVNPFTAAAAAAGVLALAYYQGTEESERFANALIENGNAAGLTTNQLADMANQVAASSGTVGAAAGVLTKLAAAGNPLRSMYVEITQASLAWSKQTGRDISDVVQTFNEIGKNPVEAIKKLDGELNILTASQYANIQSLQEQGKTMDAAAMAAGLYAEAINSRAGEIERNLGTLESAWQSITGAAKKAWDAMLDVGRDQTIEDQIANTEKLIAQRKGGIIGFFAGDDDQTLRGLETRLKQLQTALANNAAKAAQDASNKATQDAGKKGIDLINSTYKSSLTQTQKLQKELTDLDKARKDAIAAGGFSAAEEEKYAKSRKNIEQEIADIKAREAKKNAPKGVNKGVSEVETTFSRLYNQYDPAAQAARTLTKEQTQLQLALDKGKISQDEYGKALAQASLNYAAAIKGAQGLTQAEQYRAQLEKQLSTQRREYSIAAAGVGMGDQQAQRMQQRVQLEQQANDRILQLRTELANATTEKQRQELQAQIDLEQEYLPKRLEALQSGFAQYDAAISSPLNGWNAALANFQTSAANVAGQSQALFSGAFSSIQSSVGGAFQAMTLEGQTFGESVTNVTRSLVGSVVNSLGQMAAQWAVNQAMQVAFGQTSAAVAAQQIAQVGAVTAAETSGAAAVATAKVAADGVATASSIAATTATTTAQTAAAATTASAWLPAALVASIGSFGAAAVVGGTALLAAFALIKGFATGGYVSGPGSGTSDSIPARLSNGEFVVNAKATARNRELLEAINSNERVSFAGENISLNKVQANGQAQQQAAQPNVTVNLIEDRSRAGTVDQRTGDDGQLQIDAFVADIWGGGERAQAIEAAYGLSRNPT
ncbi:phage tail length tape measure family protein [Pseudomonas asiatica]|uniref:phage tail length tape measure family protein n=2 Tax=Pseudomonas asiatica TaxID=2219225 RepID=UPI0020C45079|nr:phage tail length tape measure family protein [Pseudomonas asiatica]